MPAVRMRTITYYTGFVWLCLPFNTICKDTLSHYLVGYYTTHQPDQVNLPPAVYQGMETSKLIKGLLILETGRDRIIEEYYSYDQLAFL
jgi:hypothetical protein